MEHAVTTRASSRTALPAWDPGRALSFFIPAAVLVYISLKRGGYDVVVFSQVGVVVWWFLLVAAVSGALVTLRMGRAGWIGSALLATFVVWNAIAWSWSESWDRAAAETARVTTYAGVFLATALIVRRRYIRDVIAGVGAGIVVVSALALASRLAPGAFPHNDTASFLPTVANRLNYPVNYWNALAAMMAMGIPIAVERAGCSLRIAAQAAWAAALPLLALTTFLTFSRGGAVALAAGLIVLLAISRHRLPLLPPLIIGSIGAAIVIAAATQRSAVEDGTVRVATQGQGNEMIVIVIAVCAAVALLQLASALLQRHATAPSWALRAYHLRRPIIAAIGVAACVVALAVGLPGKASNQWQEFKNPSLGLAASQENRIARFTSASGNGRYQFWQSAARAEQRGPLRGIGPGSFEYWWARDGSLPSFVRNAHSLYMETLAETGIVGLLLLVGFLGYVVAMAARAARRAYGVRSTAAAAAAAIAAFLVAAGVDWIWQVPALPITFLMLAGTVAAALRPPSVPRLGIRGRALIAVAADTPSITLFVASATPALC